MHARKTGEVVTLSRNDNHPLALKLCRQNYHAWRLDGAPQDRLQLLRDYMDATIAYMEPSPSLAPARRTADGRSNGTASWSADDATLPDGHDASGGNATPPM